MSRKKMRGMRPTDLRDMRFHLTTIKQELAGIEEILQRTETEDHAALYQYHGGARLAVEILSKWTEEYAPVARRSKLRLVKDPK